VLENAVIFFRLAQYSGAMILLGSSLFLIYALPASPAAALGTAWARPLLVAGAALLAIASILGLGAQAAMLAGSLAEGLDPITLRFVVTETELGGASVTRIAAAALAGVSMLALRPGRTSWWLAASLGAIATASFAWTGHGAATEGRGHYVHLAADILHSWVAAGWLGALCALFVLVRPQGQSPVQVAVLHNVLRGFSGVGTLFVVVIIVSGLINSWFLVGPSSLGRLWTTPYGQLLSLKLLFFSGMLALAAVNRYRLTPALANVLEETSRQQAALSALRWSILIETLVAFALLALVAWFGTLEPPATV
jgi:copper resistance protein D